ncbi:O-antigen ligase family protein [Tsuneonella troitsensis]|uniref:O-antigen ligase family protein n=1 Tax=Tsuneonella troitsensis TaxID=292222 RepID=UPI00137AC29A|nr:O-antigen ligase family protein [Tsuneonella troitsensis]
MFVAAYALLVARPGDLRAVRVPLVGLFLLALLMIVQLVPLPPSWWTALPGRELYARIAQDAGLAMTARPLSLAPSLTLNALFSLTVPLATILILAVQEGPSRTRILMPVAVMGGLAVVWAVAQVAGPDRGPLYTYAYTNFGFPVGPFANRNHLSLLLAIEFVLIAYFVAKLIDAGKLRLLFAGVIGMAAMVVLALVLVAGSRAGLVLASLAIVAAVRIIVPNAAQVPWLKSPRVRRLGAVALLAMVAAMVAFTLYLQQGTAIERIAGDSALKDGRFERVGLVLRMLQDHWIAGIGFGAFASVFTRYETTEVLSPLIFNQAHNDWLQFLIEGGLPAAFLLLAGLMWVARKTGEGALARGNRFDAEGLVAVAIIVLTAIASAVDYPLRTPIIMMLAASATYILAGKNTRSQ